MKLFACDDTAACMIVILARGRVTDLVSSRLRAMIRQRHGLGPTLRFWPNSTDRNSALRTPESQWIRHFSRLGGPT
jgi:hypothetical protein